MLFHEQAVTPRATEVVSRARRLTENQRVLVKNVLEEKLKENWEELKETRKRLGANDGRDSVDSVYGIHAGSGTDQDEANKAFAMCVRLERGTRNLQEGLQRMMSKWKTFDVCEGCGRPIGFGRLSCKPDTSQCILCKANGKR